ncbi:hypothetical protein BJP40_29585 [Streptomyces sp. CC53]|uniref:transcriptional regulator n=1 Tax=unclassified Streptomyces TaxID=2593676 RepID=UPI0008DE7D8E|nr:MULTISPECIES: helix-turn-helix transcriptional regulator [unclassified Streptomyces]OII62253.1 hypothetical protein BJP40_29585 [Streptomyces sp. CC53]
MGQGTGGGTAGQPEEVERFAEHLRDLKDRTGRSYGALAERLHIGRSTLHRYCLGETVPVDYAVVDRLARLAGASREELVELHRRWVLADEARTRAATRPPEPERQPHPAGPPEAPHGTPGTAPADAARHRDRPGDGGDAGHRADSAPGHGTGDDTEHPADSAHGNGSGPHRPTGDHPGHSSSGTPESPAGNTGDTGRPHDGDTLLPAPGAPPSPEPHIRIRQPRADGPRQGAAKPHRLRWAVAAGTAAALVAAAVIAADMTGLRSGPGQGPATDAAAPTGAPSSAPPPQEAADPPTWIADSHVWDEGCDHRYLVDRAPSAVPAPPVEQDARTWAQGLGAVHAGRTVVRATVSAPQSGSAVVERLSVRVAERRTPLDWPVYAMSDGCGGSLSPAYFAVDLDAARPLARPVDGADTERTLPAPRLPYRVTKDDPLVVRVEAAAAHCDCDWYLEAEWSSGGQRGTLRIDDGGRPFRTSGAAEPGREHAYAVETGTWAAR